MSNHSDYFLLLDEGNTYLINQEYASAISSFSKAIEIIHNLKVRDEETTRIEFRCKSHRAQAYLEVGGMNVHDALADTDAALALLDGPLNPSRLLLAKEIDACKTRRRTALSSLKSSTHQDSSTKDYTTTSESNSSKKDDPLPNISTSIKNEPSCPKYQYYQNDNFMTISILEANVKPEQIQVEFETKHLSVVIEKEGRKFTVIYSSLYDEINVEKSKIKFMDEKVLIKLNKMNEHEWHDLFERGESKKTSVKKDSITKTSSSSTSSTTVAKPVTRPYASHKDWNAIERDVVREEENETPDGEEAVQKLFQSIYKNANEDTRRAMIKSFQTSGGTCLSTNWEEVEKKDYEKDRIVPKGQEWKNWEGERLPSKED